ncbi:MAG TPA: hypothetical protein DIS76_01465 [Rhodospirillaceae bacterium]|nr:hypothetical protein [Rhodospirillaceae bacterium]
MTPEVAARTIFVDVHNTLLRNGNLNMRLCAQIINFLSEGYSFAIFSDRMSDDTKVDLIEKLRAASQIDLLNLPMISKHSVKDMMLGGMVDNQPPEREALQSLQYWTPQDFAGTRIEKIRKQLAKAWGNKDSGCKL